MSTRSQACVVCHDFDAGCKPSSPAPASEDTHPQPVANTAETVFSKQPEPPLAAESMPGPAEQGPGFGAAACQCPECIAGWPSTAPPAVQYPQPPPVPGFYPGYPGFWPPFPQQQPPPQWPSGAQPQMNYPQFKPLPGGRYQPQPQPAFPYPFAPLPRPTMYVPTPVAGSFPQPAMRDPGQYYREDDTSSAAAPRAPAPTPPQAAERPEGCVAWCGWCRRAFDDTPSYVAHMRAAHPVRVTLPIPVPLAVPPSQKARSKARSVAELLSLLRQAPFRWGDFSGGPGAFPLVQQQPDPTTIAALQQEVMRLEALCGQQLSVFGSLAQNLGSRSSDLDLCVAPVPDQPSAVTLRGVADRLRENGFPWFDALLHARVPVLTAMPSAPVQFDISVASEGLANSWLVRAYVLANPDLVYPLTSTLVTALKRCELHGNRIGCLSSFAVVIMVLHFLLWRGRIAFIAPPTQFGFHEYEAFPAHQPLSPPKDHEAVRALLVDCLHFYSGPEATTKSEGTDQELSAETPHFPAERVAVRLTPEPWADPLARQAPATGEPRPLVVLDPVQPELDAARSLGKGNWQRIRQVFRLVASLAEATHG